MCMTTASRLGSGRPASSPIHADVPQAADGASTWSTTTTWNRSVGEWGAVFGDPVVATAILDRLLHHSHVITIRGDSYRLREKRRAGLLQKAGPALETEVETT